MAISLFDQARAIVWAQWRTLLNFYPRAKKWTSALSLILTLLWYAGWAVGAWIVAARIAVLNDTATGQALLTYGLVAGFFYWQVVPLMLATAGASLEMKKLIVYPIPHSQLFLLDAMLRVSTGLEVLIMMTGAAIGILLNHRLPWWCVLAFLPYVAFNLALAAGVRELLTRLMARRFLREIIMFLFVLLGAIPQFLLMAGDRLKNIPGFKFLPVLAQWQKATAQFLPWAATAKWAMAASRSQPRSSCSPGPLPPGSSDGGNSNVDCVSTPPPPKPPSGKTLRRHAGPNGCSRCQAISSPIPSPQ